MSNDSLFKPKIGTVCQTIKHAISSAQLDSRNRHRSSHEASKRLWQRNETRKECLEVICRELVKLAPSSSSTVSFHARRKSRRTTSAGRCNCQIFEERRNDDAIIKRLLLGPSAERVETHGPAEKNNELSERSDAHLHLAVSLFK